MQSHARTASGLGQPARCEQASANRVPDTSQTAARTKSTLQRCIDSYVVATRSRLRGNPVERARVACCQPRARAAVGFQRHDLRGADGGRFHRLHALRRQAELVPDQLDAVADRGAVATVETQVERIGLDMVDAAIDGRFARTAPRWRPAAGRSTPARRCGGATNGYGCSRKGQLSGDRVGAVIPRTAPLSACRRGKG